ncbi:MAG: ribosomal-processing cysteine protease Prp [Syntrophomonadaceae bacterium]|nr:ribosomal-processing cysteine protease Prp [Syntrophomonadaceae bacterium]MDD3022284.1 ribosomal-processing cysteine protease Prp [Syntrophomonadaceae bacterium]
MVEVLISYEEHKIVSFAVKGHSGFAPEGTDICCAGVSAIAQTALLGLIKHLQRKPFYQVEKGVLQCKLAPLMDKDEEQTAQIILSTMEAGLLSMQEAYKGFIKVDIRRC